MILMLRDDCLIETFDSPESPPSWIEWTDVEKEEYTFCSDAGQQFKGKLVRTGGFFAPEKWRLIAIGSANVEYALALVDRAKGVDSDRCQFKDLKKLRKHIVKQGSSIQ